MYARNSELRQTGTETADANHPMLEQMDAEISMNQNLHLVPCRWERSGWRYVQKDPGTTRFFQNPNRVNNFGVSGVERRGASLNRAGDSFYGSANRSSRLRNASIGGVPTSTTYGRFFVDQK
jgi:hypothetical protein